MSHGSLRIAAACGALLAATLATRAPAQSAPTSRDAEVAAWRRPVPGDASIGIGDTLRLEIEGPRVDGVLAGADSAALYVVPDWTTDTVRVARTLVREASVHRGRRARGGQAAVIGLFAGVIVGVTAGQVVTHGEDPHDPFRGLTGAVVMAGTIVVGLLSGVVAAVLPVDVWKTFDPATLRITIDG